MRSAPRGMALLAVLLAVALLVPAAVADLQYPQRPAARVNDFAGLLAPGQERDLEQRLADFERRTSNQLMVVTFPDAGGDVVEDVSIRLAEKWGAGGRQNDNGLILIVFVQERKVRFEVGYGLEGALPDALAARIIRNEISPRFGQGDFSGGIAAGMQAAMQAVQGEYRGTGRRKSTERNAREIGGLIIPIIFILIFLFGGRRGRSALMWYLILGGGRGGFTGGRGGFSGGGGGFSTGGGGFGGGGATGSW